MVTLAFSLFCIVLVLGIQQKASNPELDIASCMTDGVKSFGGSIKQLFIALKASKTSISDVSDDNTVDNTESDK